MKSHHTALSEHRGKLIFNVDIQKHPNLFQFQPFAIQIPPIIFIYDCLLGKEEVKTLSQEIICMVYEWIDLTIRHHFLPVVLPKVEKGVNPSCSV